MVAHLAEFTWDDAVAIVAPQIDTTCPTCSGNGFVSTQPVDQPGKPIAMPVLSTCPTCQGVTFSRPVAHKQADMVRTRASIPTQLREAGHTLEASTGADGRLVYIVDGEEMDLKEAADKYLGGWDKAFGSDGTQAH